MKRPRTHSPTLFDLPSGKPPMPSEVTPGGMRLLGVPEEMVNWFFDEDIVCEDERQRETLYRFCMEWKRRGPGPKRLAALALAAREALVRGLVTVLDSENFLPWAFLEMKDPDVRPFGEFYLAALGRLEEFASQVSVTSHHAGGLLTSGWNPEGVGKPAVPVLPELPRPGMNSMEKACWLAARGIAPRHAFKPPYVTAEGS